MGTLFNMNQRLSRKNYWIYQIYLFSIGFVLELISRLFFNTSSIGLSFFAWSNITGVNVIKIVLIVLTLINIIFQSKRLLDIGYSRLISLISLFILGTGVLPVLGSIPTILCLLIKSNNKA
ncbi:DUF805 domain-containing protein [Vagococcus sp. DIV0080]|uniref:DUF805 domain-containing protein n=1 Tax=Candidatus Vagococcus giribetii TaxID=2230876 RepID=A0ABS3HW42_9ENTE|nr:DUF805 domain-containing protein [Vagococcus sp. DIV0080]MBO0477964.1 DUF805 domain-containing protein [Vagococcus sp. DIV0080]